HNEGFAPDQLFRRTEMGFQAEHLSRVRMLEPLVVDGANAIAGAKNNVDEIVAAENLGEPVRKRHFGGKTALAEKFEHRGDVPRTDEQVQVFGNPERSGVLLERVRPADQIR